jgi:hypothetical protein
MTPARRWRVALAWGAAAHLLIALIYSTHLQVEHFIPGWLDRPLRVYGDYSGAHTHFNFFAPVVVSQVRVTFKIGLPGGTTRELRIDPPSDEARLRVAGMFNYFLRPTAREPLVQAWARHVLDTTPEAQWVQTRVELLDIPTLAQMKAGRTAQWVEIGRYGAVRGPAGTLR